MNATNKAIFLAAEIPDGAPFPDAEIQRQAPQAQAAEVLPHSPNLQAPPASKVLVFTVPEVAALLKVTPCTVYDLVSRGFLRRARGIRHLRITARSLDNYLKLADAETL